MKRKSLTLAAMILVLSLGVVALGQDAGQTKRQEVSVKYDKFTELTTISSPMEKISEEIRVDLFTLSKGKKDNEPVLVLEIYIVHSADDAAFSQEGFDTVFFIADEKRFHIALHKYVPHRGSAVIEVADVRLTDDQFSQIVMAKKLEAKWGGIEFEFNRQSLDDFRKVKALLDGSK